MPQKTPTLTKLIKDAIESRLLDLHVCLPARVERYDVSKQQADVQPLLKRRYRKNEDEVILPIITNVPVVWSSANNNSAFITLPLKKGDTGFIIFCERSLDTWLVQGGLITPNDPRKHDLSDGIFMPGLHDFKNVIPDASEDNIIIKNNDAKIELKPDGSIKMEGAVTLVGDKRLIDERLIEIFNSHKHVGVASGIAVSGSPEPPGLMPDDVCTEKVTAE